MIEVDISNVWGQIALPDLLAMESEAAAAHEPLMEGTGAGSAFRDWLNLPGGFGCVRRGGHRRLLLRSPGGH